MHVCDASPVLCSSDNMHAFLASIYVSMHAFLASRFVSMHACLASMYVSMHVLLASIYVSMHAFLAFIPCGCQDYTLYSVVQHSRGGSYLVHT